MIKFNYKIGDDIKSSKVMVFASLQLLEESLMIESLNCIKYNIDWYNWERIRAFDVEIIPNEFIEEMKYVAFKIEDKFIVVVFEKQFIHEEFMDVVYNVMYENNIELTEVCSAGFINSDLIPYGSSESIGIESFYRNEITELVKSFMQ